MSRYGMRAVNVLASHRTEPSDGCRLGRVDQRPDRPAHGIRGRAKLEARRLRSIITEMSAYRDPLVVRDGKTISDYRDELEEVEYLAENAIDSWDRVDTDDLGEPLNTRTAELSRKIGGIGRRLPTALTPALKDLLEVLHEIGPATAVDLRRHDRMRFLCAETVRKRARQLVDLGHASVVLIPDAGRRCRNLFCPGGQSDVEAS